MNILIEENYYNDNLKITKSIEKMNDNNEKSKYLLQRWYDHILTIQRNKIKIYLEFVYKTLLKYLNVDRFDSNYILSMNLLQINELLNVFPNSLIFIRAMFEVEILSLDKMKFELINYQLINDEMKLPKMNELNFKIFEVFFNNTNNNNNQYYQEKKEQEEQKDAKRKKTIEFKLTETINNNIKRKNVYFRKCRKLLVEPQLPIDNNKNKKLDDKNKNLQTNTITAVKICSLTCTIENCQLFQYIQLKNEQILNFKTTTIFYKQNVKKRKKIITSSAFIDEETFLNNIYGDSIGNIQLLSKYIYYKLHSELLLKNVDIVMDRIIQNMLTSSIKLIHEERQFNTCIKLLDKYNYICINDCKKNKNLSTLSENLQNKLHWINFTNGMYGKHQTMTNNKNSNLNADMIIKNKLGQYLIIEMKSARDKQGAWHRTKEILSTNTFLNDVINNFYIENIIHCKITFKSILIIAGSFTKSHIQLIKNQNIEVIWEHDINNFEKLIK